MIITPGQQYLHELIESYVAPLRSEIKELRLKLDTEPVKNNAALRSVSTSTDYQEPIDIYSEEGTKVKYTGKGGYDHHKEHANKHLKVGKIYTIDHTDVGGWHTDVYLKEVPSEVFNSVHFINAE